MSTPPAPPSGPTRVARPKSLRDSLLDMGRSLGLLLIIMALVLFLTPARGLIFPDKKDRMQAVDYSSVVSGFATVAHRPALVPAGLPSSWRANASSLFGNSPANAHFHVGWVTPGNEYAGLDESTGDPAGLIKSVLGRRGATVTGTTTIGGSVWQLRTSDLGERSLTRTDGGLTVVITGTPKADINLLCASLRPA
jgi:hypothetical protein